LVKCVNNSVIYICSRQRNKEERRLIDKDGTLKIAHHGLNERKTRYIDDIFTTCVDLRWRYIFLGSNILSYSEAHKTGGKRRYLIFCEIDAVIKRTVLLAAKKSTH